MKRLSGDRRGMSEIVGALMLTLIVVVAASSFAVFIAKKQAAVQDQQLLDLERQQESLAVLGIKAQRSMDNSSFTGFNITIASNHIRESKLQRVVISSDQGDYVLRKFNATTSDQKYESFSWSDSAFAYVNGTEYLTIAPRGQVSLNVSASPYCFFSDSVHFPTVGSYVKISVDTGYQNTFARVFMSPQAFLRMSAQGDASHTNLTLDASISSAQNGSFIVSYKWHVVNDTSGYQLNLTGIKAIVQVSNADRYSISLSVTDNNGMLGLAETSYNR